MPARLRSLITLGLSDLVSAIHQRVVAIDSGIGALAAQSAATQAAIEGRIGRLEEEITELRAFVAAQDERGQRKLRAGFSSAVNLISVLPHLKIEGVLPPFPHHGWEVPGEMAAFLFHLVRRHRPKLILELGSGSSTILLAAAARANGAGRVITIEHDPAHRDRTAQFLRETELSDRVDLIEAPLVEQRFGALALQWYDLDPLLRTLAEKIDLVFVDGPPGRIQSLSRYPALPVLKPHLSPQALIVVDDGRREDELRMIEMWRELDVPFDVETLGFLPRAPILLKLGVSENRVAELRRPPDDRMAEAGSASGFAAPDRRVS